jgi:AbrB family looped-hinge helix DNA binding protein
MGQVLGFGKIRNKGEFTLPKEVREFLKLKPGDKIIVIHEDGQIVLKRGDSDIQVK